MKNWKRALALLTIVILVLAAAAAGAVYWRRNVYVPQGFTMVRRHQTVNQIDQEQGVIVQGSVQDGIKAGRVQVSGGQVRGNIISSGDIVLGPGSRVEGNVQGETVRIYGNAQVYGNITASDLTVGNISGAPWPTTKGFNLPTIYGNITAKNGSIDGRIAGDVQLDRGSISARTTVQGHIAETGNVIREQAAAPQVGNPQFRRDGAKAEQRPGRMAVPNGNRSDRFDRIGRSHRLMPWLLLPMMGLPILLGLVLLTGLAQKLIPRQIVTAWESIKAAPLRSLGHGFLSAIGTTILIAILAISIIGVPLAIVLAAGASLVGMIGLASVGLGLGRAVLHGRDASPLLEVVIGSLLLGLLLVVPILGWLAFVILAFMGYGSIASSLLTKLMPAKNV